MSTIEEFYRERYADSHPHRGHEQEPTFRQRVEAAMRVLEGGPRRVLDFGCNVGGASRMLAEAGHDVVGADISDSAIALARTRVPGARFELVPSESRLPFGDGAFDACFASEVIEHLFDVSGFLREMRRVLVPGGLLLLTTPFHGWIKNMLIVTVGFDTHFSPTGGHIRFFSRRSLTTCLGAAGFTVEGVRGIGRMYPLWKSMFVIAKRSV